MFVTILSVKMITKIETTLCTNLQGAISWKTEIFISTAVTWMVCVPNLLSTGQIQHVIRVTTSHWNGMGSHDSLQISTVSQAIKFLKLKPLSS